MARSFAARSSRARVSLAVTLQRKIRDCSQSTVPTAHGLLPPLFLHKRARNTGVNLSRDLDLFINFS